MGLFFIQALKTGDLKKAQESAQDGAITGNLTISEHLDVFEDQLFNGFEENGVEVPEKTRTVLDGFEAELNAGYISSYGLSEFTRNEDGSFSAPAAVNYGFGRETINADQLITIVSRSINAYYDDHKDELDEMETGDMVSKVYDDTIEEITANIIDTVMAEPGDSVNFLITVEEKEDGSCTVRTCVPEGNTDKIRSLAESFLEAFKEGESDKIEELADEGLYNAVSATGLLNLGYQLQFDIYDSLGLARNQVSGDAMMAILDLTYYMEHRLIRSCEIREITEEDGMGKVRADIMLDASALDFDYDRFKEDVEKRITEYTEKNEEEVRAYAEENGEEYVRQYVISEILPELMEGYLNEMKAAEADAQPEASVFDFNVYFSDGVWIICQ